MTALILGIPEIWIVLVVALLLFGHRIPSMARSLGSGIVEFKKGLSSGEGDDETLPPPANQGQATTAPSEAAKATAKEQAQA
ncbi:MAG: twin-arginine translocase TatA/TatE family subunit [Planctomycetota bacterium]